MKISRNAAAEFARLRAIYPAPTIAAPAIITGRAPIRSRSLPSNGLLSPAASGAAAPKAENHPRLHPKCLTTGRKNTPPAFTGPQIKNSVANRVPTTSQRSLLSSAMIHLAARDFEHGSRELGPTIFLKRHDSRNWTTRTAAVHFFTGQSGAWVWVRPGTEFGAAPAVGRDAESSRCARTQQRPRPQRRAPAQSAAGLHA